MMLVASVQLGTPERRWAERPLSQKQIWAVRVFLDRERRIRDRALFALAIDSKLRGCNLVKIGIRNVVAWKLSVSLGGEMSLKRTS